MNKIHRIIWSTAHNAWVVCSEISKAYGKSSRTVRNLLTAATFLPVVVFASDTTLPTGGQITAGEGSISQSTNTLNINQYSQNLTSDWQSFNIGQDATVNFNQPNSSAVALNRVTGTDPSRILGNLNANGHVFLENGNGIIFGKNAQLNVGGLVASTQAITTDGNGNYRTDGSSDAGISNLGSISAQNGGTVALIANEVDNSGIITAPNGNVRLTAGEAVTLKLQDGSLTDYRIERGALNALVDNGGAVIADGGVVHLTAEGKGELRKAAVNHSGKIEANAVSRNDKGEIVLLADKQGGRTDVSGSLIADGGGFIEASAAAVNITDDVNINTGGGTFLIDPYDFVIDADKTKGNITGKALGGLLSKNDVTLETSSDGKCSITDCRDNINDTGQGSLFVNDDVTWASDKKLTLEADDSIYINNAINANHADAKVALVYGKDTSKMEADYHFGTNGKIIFHTDAGGKQNFSTQKGSEAVIDYTVITALGSAGDEADASANNSLQGLGHSSKLSGNYVLGRTIDATVTANWNDDGVGTKQGFKPIGNTSSLSGDKFNGIGNSIGDTSSLFSGKFNGIGNSINNLTINRASEDYIGFFGATSNANLNYIILNGVNIKGHNIAGSLVGGMDDSSISNSYATGDVVGEDRVGGLVGAVIRSHKAEFKSANELVTIRGNSNVSNSHALANVIGSTNVGGLVGDMIGNVSNSYATGNVKGKTHSIGGLIGYVIGNVSNSYATGDVVGEDGVGGLVGGMMLGSVSNSYATGNVRGKDLVGGLVGSMAEVTLSRIVISNSYATGNVVGEDRLGGLVGGMMAGSVSNSYATGNITGKDRVGGIVGEIGKNSQNTTITASYWDTKNGIFDMCGQDLLSVCNNNNGKKSADMKAPKTFTDAGWKATEWKFTKGRYPTLNDVSGQTSEQQPKPQFIAIAGNGASLSPKPVPTPVPIKPKDNINGQSGNSNSGSTKSDTVATGSAAVSTKSDTVAIGTAVLGLGIHVGNGASLSPKPVPTPVPIKPKDNINGQSGNSNSGSTKSDTVATGSAAVSTKSDTVAIGTAVLGLGIHVGNAYSKDFTNYDGIHNTPFKQDQFHPKKTIISSYTKENNIKKDESASKFVDVMLDGFSPTDYYILALKGINENLNILNSNLLKANLRYLEKNMVTPLGKFTEEKINTLEIQGRKLTEEEKKQFKKVAWLEGQGISQLNLNLDPLYEFPENEFDNRELITSRAVALTKLTSRYNLKLADDLFNGIGGVTKIADTLNVVKHTRNVSNFVFDTAKKLTKDMAKFNVQDIFRFSKSLVGLYKGIAKRDDPNEIINYIKRSNMDKSQKNILTTELKNNVIDTKKYKRNVLETLMIAHQVSQELMKDKYNKLILDFMKKGNNEDKILFIAQQKVLDNLFQSEKKVDMRGKDIFFIKKRGCGINIICHFLDSPYKLVKETIE